MEAAFADRFAVHRTEFASDRQSNMDPGLHPNPMQPSPYGCIQDPAHSRSLQFTNPSARHSQRRSFATEATTESPSACQQTAFPPSMAIPVAIDTSAQTEGGGHGGGIPERCSCEDDSSDWSDSESEGDEYNVGLVEGAQHFECRRVSLSEQQQQQQQQQQHYRDYRDYNVSLSNEPMPASPAASNSRTPLLSPAVVQQSFSPTPNRHSVDVDLNRNPIQYSKANLQHPAGKLRPLCRNDLLTETHPRTDTLSDFRLKSNHRGCIPVHLKSSTDSSVSSLCQTTISKARSGHQLQEEERNNEISYWSNRPESDYGDFELSQQTPEVLHEGVVTETLYPSTAPSSSSASDAELSAYESQHGLHRADSVAITVRGGSVLDELPPSTGMSLCEMQNSSGGADADCSSEMASSRAKVGVSNLF